MLPLTGTEHVGTAGRRAILWNGTVEEVDVFKKRNRCTKKTMEQTKQKKDVKITGTQGKRAKTHDPHLEL